MIEKTLAHRSKLHLMFIDLRKAYDSVPTIKLWEAMQEKEIHPQYINAIKLMYEQNVKAQ